MTLQALQRLRIDDALIIPPAWQQWPLPSPIRIAAWTLLLRASPRNDGLISDRERPKLHRSLEPSRWRGWAYVSGSRGLLKAVTRHMSTSVSIAGFACRICRIVARGTVQYCTLFSKLGQSTRPN